MTACLTTFLETIKSGTDNWDAQVSLWLGFMDFSTI
jgi:hypothetical protein